MKKLLNNQKTLIIFFAFLLGFFLIWGVFGKAQDTTRVYRTQFLPDSIEILDSAGNYVKIPLPKKMMPYSRITPSSATINWFHEKGQNDKENNKTKDYKNYKKRNEAK